MVVHHESKCGAAAGDAGVEFVLLPGLGAATQPWWRLRSYLSFKVIVLLCYHTPTDLQE